MAIRKRSLHVTATVNPAELEEVRKAATAMRVPMATFMRMATFEKIEKIQEMKKAA